MLPLHGSASPRSAAPTALVYITLGAVLTVWSGIWFIYLQNNPPDASQFVYYLARGAC